MLVFFSSVVFVVLLVFYLVQQRYKYWNELGFESPPSSFPFGSIKDFVTKYQMGLGMQKYYENFKGRVKAVGIYLFLSPVLLITDIELVKNIYIREFNSFHDRGFYYNREDDPLSANLVS